MLAAFCSPAHAAGNGPSSHIQRRSTNSILRPPRRFPDVAYSEVIVDNACMQLVRDPTQYDMLLMPNLYVRAFPFVAAFIFVGCWLTVLEFGMPLGCD